MLVNWPIHAVMFLGLFAIGAVVGSFLNVCIYRIPYEKSVIWPASHCPRCRMPIAARDNIPVVSWLALRGECRTCGLRISPRYPLIEALVGLLFAGLYVLDVVHGPPIPWWSGVPTAVPVALAYHAVFVALLVTATFIDFDFTEIPDIITLPGMIVGLAVGTLVPEIRPAPGFSALHAEGFKYGLIGLFVGGGMTQAVRLFGRLIFFRGEAMGFGDVTLMAMIGAFLGWQAAVLAFFLGAFYGLGHSAWKLVKLLGKLLRRRKWTRADHEIPFGPYLSLGALTMLFSWPWLWPGWAGPLFNELHQAAVFLLSMTPFGTGTPQFPR